MTERGGPGAMLCSWGFHDLTLCRYITAGICSWCVWFVNLLVILAQADQVLLVPAANSVSFSFLLLLKTPKGRYPCHLTQTQVVHLLFLVLVITLITLSVASTWTSGEPLGTSGFLPGFENTKSASHVISSGLPGTPLQYSCLANPMDGGAW